MHLSIDAVARRLSVSVSTVERWIRQGRIPVEKSGGSPLFDKSTIEKWAKTHSMTVCAAEDGQQCRIEPEPYSLVAAMERGGFCHDVPGKDVRAVLEAVVKTHPGLAHHPPALLLEKLLARETLASTGIGKGVAIPHPRQPLDGGAEPAVIATAFLRQPVPFHAVDDLPVFVLFILISPSVSAHLNLLSRLAFCIRSDPFVAFLKTRPEPRALLDRIARFEADLDNGPSS